MSFFSTFPRSLSSRKWKKASLLVNTLEGMKYKIVVLRLPCKLISFRNENDVRGRYKRQQQQQQQQQQIGIHKAFSFAQKQTRMASERGVSSCKVSKELNEHQQIPMQTVCC